MLQIDPLAGDSPYSVNSSYPHIGCELESRASRRSHMQKRILKSILASDIISGRDVPGLGMGRCLSH